MDLRSLSLGRFIDGRNKTKKNSRLKLQYAYLIHDQAEPKALSGRKINLIKMSLCLITDEYNLQEHVSRVKSVEAK